VAEALGLSGRAWVHISLDIVRVGVEAIERALTAAPGAAAVCDAETDADLDHIAKVVRRSPGRSLPLGSAGLSAALARQMPSRTSPERDWPEANAPADGRLAVIGSRHAAARKQAAALAAHVGMARVLADSPDPVTRCLSALECGVALLVSPDRDGDAEEIASALARTTRMVLETRSSAGRAWPSLLLTGGDAARHLLVSLGCHGIALTGEAQPGMARGVLLGGPYAGLSVVTKAGGFGDEDALIRWCGRL
jgi:uncharacterized protein YgbK (DUF1537 family)